MVAAVDMVDIQARIADGLAHDRDFRSYCTLIAETGHAASNAHTVFDTGMPLEQMLDFEAARMRGAYTYHVSDEMAAVIRGAATALLDRDESFSVSFEPETMPVDNGFVLFDPIDVPGGVGFETDPSVVFTSLPGTPESGLTPEGGDAVLLPTVRLAGFSWGPVQAHARAGSALHGRFGDAAQSGVRLTFYAQLEHQAAWLARTLTRFVDTAVVRYERQQREIGDRMTELGVTQEWLDGHSRRLSSGGVTLDVPDDMEDRMRELVRWAEDQAETREIIDSRDEIIRKGSMLDNDPRLRPYRYIPVLSIAVPRAPVSIEAATTDVDGAKLLCLVWTFFHMCSQTIVSAESEPAPRAAARRWRDMPLPKQVTVIRLRRASNSNDRVGESNVVWHHRWMVRGHWRMQAYGPGRSERRPVWIAPFVKGPDGAPLIITDKVYDLVR